MRSKGNSRQARERRLMLFYKQGGICVYCQRMMTLDYQDKLTPWKVAKNYATFEHLVPRSEGGTSKDDNVVLACSRCNFNRHAPLRLSDADDYDPQKDLAGSIKLGLEKIRDRIAAGGPRWELKS